MLPLRDYQKKFCDAFVLKQTQYGALDAGLGKTLCAIEIAQRLKAKNVLVICPNSVKLSWITELRKWDARARFHAPKNAEDVGAFEAYRGNTLWTIINYDKLSRSVQFLEKLIAQGPYSLCVIDEAHAVKELTSKRTRAIFRHIAPICQRVLPLSATPMTRSASDLYAPLRFLRPEAVTDRNGRMMTLHDFQDRYCNVEIKRIGMRSVREVTGSRNMKELKERMGAFFYRLTKAECLPELPPMQFELAPIALAPSDYKEVVEATQGIEIDDQTFDSVLQDEHIMRALRLIGSAKVGPAAEYINEYLEGCEAKVVIWGRHHDVIDALCAKLSHHSPAVIDGRVDMKGRAAAVDAFLTDPTCRIFIGQISAAGTGLTLLNEAVQPRDVFFVENEWSPSLNYQAASRVHRIGQRDGVLVRTFIAQGVRLDTHLQAVLNRKISEFAQLMDGEKNDD